MSKGKTPQIKLSDLKNIRISINDDYFDLIIDIVDALLENNNNANLVSHLNKIVYNIYGITDDEIKYIETYLKSSKES